MKKYRLCILLSCCLLGIVTNYGFAQTNKGINFQGIARDNNGYIITNKSINIRISIKSDSNSIKSEYQEITPITTNVLGLFAMVVGAYETNKIVTVGPFENINWSKAEKYLQIEIDTVGDLSFIYMGTQKINYVPFSFYADNVGAQNINGVIGLSQGGTGLDNLKDVKVLYNIDKINNTPDSSKPISNLTLAGINDKLKKADTLSLSNRINLKLSSKDTISLSNRINNMSSLSVVYDYGSFYDTAKQAASGASSATALKFSYDGLVNNISIVPNTSGQPTKITVLHAGVYNVHYAIQIIKADVGVDELSVWIRRNGSAYLNTNTNFNISGSSLKNLLTGNYLVDLGANDYIEIYFSVKNISSVVTGTIAQASPSRPATPSVYINLQKLN
ncbi:MAG: hypothetical protein D4R91_00620 [Sediminibacterium sp.]|nr:MAG: hypothetical protein D4R91_00620 [Sediminibacterium sp.]